MPGRIDSPRSKGCHELAVRTGRTLAGTALYLQEKNAQIVTVCTDPCAAMSSWLTHGHTGIRMAILTRNALGQSRVTKNLEGLAIDLAYRIEDQAALTIVYHIVHEEGLSLGFPQASPGRRGAPGAGAGFRPDHRPAIVRFRVEVSIQTGQTGMADGTRAGFPCFH